MGSIANLGSLFEETAAIPKLVLVQGRGLKPRKSPAGKSTNDLIVSAHQSDNSELFPAILSLYVPPGSTVADITYGKGVFWRKVPPGVYRLAKTDLKEGVDCRHLPYKDASFDCVVFDPPYMHTPGGTAHNGHQNFENYYQNNVVANGTGKKYHEAVLDLYFKASDEVHRVLKPEGVYVVKCQDEVCANKQRLTHIEITNYVMAHGFIVEDLFVLVRKNKPGVSRVLTQKHARKNHSYFMVFRKRTKKQKASAQK